MGEPMPSPRKSIANAVVVLDNVLYVVGGLDGSGQPTSTVLTYNTATELWSETVPMPVPLWRAMAVAHQGKLYVFGGYRTTNFPFSPSSLTLVYDPTVGTWTEGTPMPRGRGASAIVATETDIRIFGGLAGSDLDEHLIYSPGEDMWSEGPAMPTSRSGLTAVYIAGRIHVVGGYVLGGAGTIAQNAVETFDMVQGAWRIGASLPSGRHGLSSAVLDGDMVVFGGFRNEDLNSRSLSYDPDVDAWTVLPDMPDSRSFAGAAAHGNQIFVVGGGSDVLLPLNDAVPTVRIYTTTMQTATDDMAVLPVSLHLKSAFPIPTRDRITVEFELARTSTVTAALHDITGRLVVYEVLGTLSGGAHSWTSGGLSGVISAGSYMLTLRSGHDRATIPFIKR